MGGKGGGYYPTFTAKLTEISRGGITGGAEGTVKPLTGLPEACW